MRNMVDGYVKCDNRSDGQSGSGEATMLWFLLVLGLKQAELRLLQMVIVD